MKIFLHISKYLKQKRTIKKINKALSISLYDWQINYIFNNGSYCGENGFNRGNGKTLANVLKLLFSEGDTICICLSQKEFFDRDFYYYAREDNTNKLRRRFFVDEVIKVYSALCNIKGLKIREIEFDINRRRTKNEKL